MENKMVERVADAIAQSLGMARDATVSDVLERRAAHSAGSVTAAARAAIEALRRPSDDMIRAGMKHQIDLGKTGISISDTWSQWKAMIDAALTPTNHPA